MSRGLASVIVACSGQMAMTQRSVASLVRHTRGPWELIAVDNGSIDGTAAYLAGVRDVAPFPVTIVSHAANQGVAAAYNQALAVARGTDLVLLDPTVVVTDGWLEQLVALADSDPTIGMTGPVSNDACPPQLVTDCLYVDLESMHQFAVRWRRERRGKWLEASRLTSFCLLIKRRALVEAGGFGEPLGSGMIDDHELGERMRRAGYRGAVALDLFVHRHGDRGGAGSGISPAVASTANPARIKPNGPRRSGKVFGIGLPRTGTTSVAAAMMELGLKTCHACFDDALYDRGEAFFDTPVYLDYPKLDQRYPGSKYILTWRDPHAWFASFTRSLGPYFQRLRTESQLSADAQIDRRCYIEAFGTDEPDEESFVARYREHRRQVEAYFRDRPNDLLVFDLTDRGDPWDPLCKFLGLPRPAIPFPHVNARNVDYWKQIHHANKL
ncbi:Glycosyltransferase, GT2 family [Singulisphaera sp. GP187]|uniref:sulfotransferase n=1 Tax=Singulisphaera sp. GP187 TaxID=1882752 RepID=UPI0009276BD0|nr:sulfotransferase [Singulisphaera sp. GP187]SIO58943.1 Glycosyltransferase, GT2 family [Singulisphaera sp. GP187]